MNYEKKYKDALKRAKKLYEQGTITESLNYVFPELKESEDELTWLTKYIEEEAYNLSIDIRDDKDRIKLKKLQESLAWLEKQSEQKPADKVGPKFKVGDWITNGYVKCQITFIDSRYWYSETCVLGKVIDIDKTFHLWTIEDAEDGDVLAYVTDEEDLWIMIYQSLYEPYEGHVHYHALLVNDDFSDKGTCCICIDDLKPATKEQSDFLFSKMKETGYKWDKEKKRIE